MKKLYLVAVLLLTASVMPTKAAFTNGSFETGDFTGWTTIGTTTVVSGLANGVTPSNGLFQAFTSTNPGTSSAALNAFLGTTLPVLGSPGGAPTTGSAIQQSVLLGTGSTVTFDWSNGGQDAGFDYSFVVINGTTTILSSGGFTPYGTFSFTAPSAGLYTFSVGNTNTLDTLFTSTLNVDNFVQTNPVPVPPSLLMLFVGGTGLGLFRRYRA